MSNISNPRFPHYCRILRYAVTGPLEDQPAVQDSDPMADDMLCPDAYGAEQVDGEHGDPVKTYLQDGISVIYEGKCRSDNRDTISDNGEVIASYRTLALPLKQDEWTEDNVPIEGDKIELQRFGYKEYGLVIDKRPSNLGTHILWKYVRN